MIVQNKKLLLSKFILLILLILSYETVQAEKISAISKIVDDDDRLPWWYGHNSPRIGFAMQKASFLELGYSRYLFRYFKSSYHYHPLHCIYVSAELGPAFNQKKESFYGIKIGYELNANKWPFSPINNWAVGFETKYLTDWNKNVLFIIPKAGITLWNFNLFYGYNILKNQNQLDRVGNHQISLIFNLRKPYLIVD